MNANEEYQKQLHEEINKLEIQISIDQNEIRSQKSVNADLKEQFTSMKDMNEYYMSSYQHLEEVKRKRLNPILQF